MTVLRAYVRDRQGGVLLVAVGAMAVMLGCGGDFNLPVPGAPVPIVLGALAPLFCACVWISGLDGQHHAWLEAVTPRRAGTARCCYVTSVALLCALVVLVAGTYSVGLVVAAALVRGAGLLIGAAALAWLVKGRAEAFGTVTAVTMVTVVVGGHGAAPGQIWAPWALLFAAPGDLLAGVCGATGALTAAVAAWVKE